MSGLHAQVQVTAGDFSLDITIEAAPGETVVVVGPNGAGKSTAIRAIAGLVPVGAGRIALGSRVLDDPEANVFVPPHNRGIGIAFQDNLLFPHLSARENIVFGAAAGADTGLADDWLERLGIADLANRKVTELSGGQARRVAIARAMVAATDLLILDEPFAGLDVTVRAALRRTLDEHLRSHSASRLLVVHDPTDAHALADRIVVIEAGRIAQQGTPSEIRRAPATPYVADLVGLNLLEGVASGGHVAVRDSDLVLSVADQTANGPVRVTVTPHEVALHRDAPHGSPRNSWIATVGAVHQLGDVVRVYFDAPVPIAADVTPAAVRDLDIAPGHKLWVAVKATGLSVSPA